MDSKEVVGTKFDYNEYKRRKCEWRPHSDTLFYCSRHDTSFEWEEGCCNCYDECDIEIARFPIRWRGR